jgi:hypothetical protein
VPDGGQRQTTGCHPHTTSRASPPHLSGSHVGIPTCEPDKLQKESVVSRRGDGAARGRG